MQGKTLFKFSPISYSQFLRSEKKEHSFLHHFRYLAESRDSSIDMEFFKRSISLHYQHVYAAKKWQNWCYRCIFFIFGLLFLVLAGIIFFKTTNFACGLYFKNCFLLKNCINIFCLFLAGGAFAIGYQIHPEKEAMQYLVGKVERELNSPAKHLQIEFNAIIANLSHNNIEFSSYTRNQ